MRYKPCQKQRGSATLLVLLLVAGMLLLVEGVASVVRVQYATAQIHRHTSSTYDLLEESLEKFVDAVNQLLDHSSMELVKKVKNLLHQTLFTSQTGTNASVVQYKLLSYQDDKGFSVNNKWLSLKVMQYIYEILLKEYTVDTSYDYRAKPISYTVQADRRETDYVTLIEVVPYFSKGQGSIPYSEWTSKEFINNDKLKQTKGLASYTTPQINNAYKEVLWASKKNQSQEAIGVQVRAKTQNNHKVIYDQEDVVATLRFDTLDKIEHYLLEQYEWVDKPPEHLAYPIFCFGNIKIDEGATIEKQSEIAIQVASIGSELKDYLQLESLEQLIKQQQNGDRFQGVIILEQAGVVDVSQLYRDEEPVPTVVIAQQQLELIATQPNQATFKGLVIALDNMSIKKSIAVEGSMVVGGDCYIMEAGTVLKVDYQPNILWDVTFGQQKVLRRVLEILGLINFKAPTVEAMFKVDGSKQYIKLKPEFDLVLEGFPLQVSISQLRTRK